MFTEAVCPQPLITSGLDNLCFGGCARYSVLFLMFFGDAVVLFSCFYLVL